MLRALFALEIFTFCRDILIMYKYGFTRKLRLTSKFMTSQTEQ